MLQADNAVILLAYYSSVLIYVLVLSLLLFMQISKFEIVEIMFEFGAFFIDKMESEC